MRGININTYFANVQVGDNVWDFIFGWGLVMSIDLKKHSAICVGFERGQEWYDFQGKLYPDTNQSLFWNRVLFKRPAYTKIDFILKTLNEILGMPKELNITLPDGDITINKDIIPAKLREHLGKKISGFRRTDKDGSVFYETDGMRVKKEWIIGSAETYTVHKEPQMIKHPPVKQIEKSDKIDRKSRKEVDDIACSPSSKKRSSKKLRKHLTPKQVQEIRALRGKKTTIEIAKICKISAHRINRIQRGSTYGDVLNPDGFEYIPPLFIPIYKKLTPKQVQEIRALRGIKSQVAIGKIYGIWDATVSSIQLGRICGNVLNPDGTPYVPPSPQARNLCLTSKQIQEIRALRGKKSQREIAKLYKISASMVRVIHSGNSRGNVPNPDDTPYVPPLPRANTFTSEQIQEIRALRGKKTTIEIAKIYGVNSSRISSIQMGLAYRHILNPDKSKYVPPNSMRNCTLTPKQVQEIRALREKKTNVEIAEIYRIDSSTVSYIYTGKNHKDVPNPDGSPYVPPPPKYKLTPEEIQEIRSLRGVKTYKEIAKTYKISTSTIAKIQLGHHHGSAKKINRFVVIGESR